MLDIPQGLIYIYNLFMGLQDALEADFAYVMK